MFVRSSFFSSTFLSCCPSNQKPCFNSAWSDASNLSFSVCRSGARRSSKAALHRLFWENKPPKWNSNAPRDLDVRFSSSFATRFRNKSNWITLNQGYFLQTPPIICYPNHGRAPTWVTSPHYCLNNLLPPPQLAPALPVGGGTEPPSVRPPPQEPAGRRGGGMEDRTKISGRGGSVWETLSGSVCPADSERQLKDSRCLQVYGKPKGPNCSSKSSRFTSTEKYVWL